MNAIALIPIALLLAYGNGANDNFKGVATLYGGGQLSYRGALALATVATLLGSLCSLYLAPALLQSFHGVGLVPGRLAGDARFVLAVGAGAGLTVMAATLLGFPISTTHGLVGAMIGAALAAQVIPDWRALEGSFIAPLLLSPLAVIPLAVSGKMLAKRAQRRLGLGRDGCLCVASEIVAAASLGESLAASVPIVTATVAHRAECDQRYADGARLNFSTASDALHVVSASAVSFARGLNDTPKIAALLVMSPLIGGGRAVALVALAVALGGLLNARKVAEIMSRGITKLDAGNALSANLATAAVVLLASRWGLPVSTTHTSCGALFGIGAASGEARWPVVAGIAAAWVITLPLAAMLAATAFVLLR